MCSSRYHGSYLLIFRNTDHFVKSQQKTTKYIYIYIYIKEQRPHMREYEVLPY